jgi:preprotein translocase subunit YajC
MRTLLMAPPPGQPQASAWMQLVPIAAIFAIFYFLLIRPARKRQRDVQKMLDELKAGDKVITSGGMLGTVMAVDRDIVQLRVADKVKVDVTKSSVVALQDSGTSSSIES